MCCKHICQPSGKTRPFFHQINPEQVFKIFSWGKFIMCSNTLVQKMTFILWKCVPHAHGTTSNFWVRWSSLVHRRNAQKLGETDCVTVACVTGGQTVDLIISRTWPTTKYRGLPSTLVLGCFTPVASCKTLTGKMLGSDLDPEPLEISDFWATRTYVDHMLQCNKFGTSSFNYSWTGNHGNKASSDAPALDASTKPMSLPSLIDILLTSLFHSSLLFLSLFLHLSTFLVSLCFVLSLFLFLFLQPMWSNASRLCSVFASGQEQANLLYLVSAHVVPAWLGNSPISADFLSRV